MYLPGGELVGPIFAPPPPGAVALALSRLKFLRIDSVRNMDPFSFAPFDPFKDPLAALTSGGVLAAKQPMMVTKGPIHIRMNKQGNRFITMIEGLDSDLDQKRIAKAMKKAFSCSTVVQKDKVGNDVILLQGDHRMHVKEWLLAQEILTAKEAEERLMLHGY